MSNIFFTLVSISVRLFDHRGKWILLGYSDGTYVWSSHSILLFTRFYLIFCFLWWKLASWKLVSDQMEVSFFRSFNFGDDLSLLCLGLFLFVLNSSFLKFPKGNFLDNIWVENLFCWWSFWRVNFEAHCNELIELFRVTTWQRLKLPFHNCSFKSLKVDSVKWRFKGGHFIKHTPQRPNIAFASIWTFFPYFRACIVRCTGLSFGHSIITDFWNIHISQLENRMFLVHENVGWFDISVENVQFVKTFESFEALNGNVPDPRFRYQLFERAVLFYVLTQVATFEELSYQTEGAWNLVIEGIHVTDNVGTVNTGKNSDFVEAVGNLFLWKGLNFNPFHSIEFWIKFSLDLIDWGKGSFAKFRNHFVLVHFC